MRTDLCIHGEIMFASRNAQLHYPQGFFFHLHPQRFRNIVLLKNFVPDNSIISREIQPKNDWNDRFSFLQRSFFLDGYVRAMSTTSGRSMRSRVERRMRSESGKTMREIRRAKRLKKKLMTDEERLIYNLKRAKKKVALLLQKLKKYELPELPSAVHDPELLTPEQLQSYKKIGFKNKNYVPVGVRGVFGGVVQNMHMHWKFHETVQVCCDNFPKEKIKEMANMLARLSGGIVIHIHNVKTIIMFRGRNYRQPQNFIPVNTLTKRKALFKARFEQALESQKLNIKKIEQHLRRAGINPEDPAAMASIQRVASTFFNAIDKMEGSPYVFREEKLPVAQPIDDNLEKSEPSADSDQEELDRFIAEIEDAADREFAAEEATEREELGRIRYWNRVHSGRGFPPSATRRDISNSGSQGMQMKPTHGEISDDDDDDDHDGYGLGFTRRSGDDDDDDDGDDSGSGSELDSEAEEDELRGLRAKGRPGFKRSSIGKAIDSNNGSSWKHHRTRPYVGSGKTYQKQEIDEEDCEIEDELSDVAAPRWESDSEDGSLSAGSEGEP